MLTIVGAKIWTVTRKNKQSHKTANKSDTAKYKKKRHVHNHTVKHGKDRSSSEEEVSIAVNTVWIMKVDGSSEGFWASRKLEGHSVKCRQTQVQGHH